MAIYGYCRVSTDRQVKEGESLGAQERTIEGYAMMHGMTLDRVFIEQGVSASKPLNDRPEGTRLLSSLSKGDVVITPKLDRMFRSALDALNTLDALKKRGVSLHMIDLGGDVLSNGLGKFMFTILSAVAEVERERIRERIKDVKTDQKKRGRYLGGAVPFGWELEEGNLRENPVEQDAIRQMIQMRSQGTSLRTIASVMKSDGFNLSHVGVSKMISAAIERKAQIQKAA
jgi:DNA invertase Pin-like site-specific DNA recombinase